ncbi:hypothetical protein FJZ19_03105 [Candidatus Pacearchaeota archaeon]|nr:hypothetical protein [Candidatus Pacearchaeota archaeon]
MIKIKEKKIIIKPEDLPPSSNKFEILGVFNPGAVRLANRNIVLYVRVWERLVKTEDKNYYYAPRMIGKKNFKIAIDKFKKETAKTKSDLDIVFKDGTKRITFISYFKRIILDKTGFNIKSIDKKPSFYGLHNDGEFGVEDPRITKIGKWYVMTYVSLSKEQNISTSLAISRDCKNWKRRGIIFGEQDKDVVIFPQKVKGKYIAFDRPESSFQFSLPHIWIAYSDNLESWGDLKPVGCVYKKGRTCPRNGAGPPPLKTDRGWLLIYHAVEEKQENNKEVYKYIVGAALFDLKNPEKVIATTGKPILLPSKENIMVFGTKRVIFPTGAIFDESKKNLLIFSGESDRVTSVSKVNLKDILKELKRF